MICEYELFFTNRNRKLGSFNATQWQRHYLIYFWNFYTINEIFILLSYSIICFAFVFYGREVFIREVAAFKVDNIMRLLLTVIFIVVVVFLDAKHSRIYYSDSGISESHVFLRFLYCYRLLHPVMLVWFSRDRSAHICVIVI